MAKIMRMQEGIEGCKFLVVRRDGTVPIWQNFVLGSRDPAAAFALRAYANEARRLGQENPALVMDRDYCDSVRHLADIFEYERAMLGNGDPGAPKHRHDDPLIVQAMVDGWRGARDGRVTTVSIASIHRST